MVMSNSGYSPGGNGGRDHALVWGLETHLWMEFVVEVISFKRWWEKETAWILCSPEKCHFPVCGPENSCLQPARGGFLCCLSGHNWETFMTCRSAGYSPCSCCWDEAQPEWPPLWYHLSNGIWWTKFGTPEINVPMVSVFCSCFSRPTCLSTADLTTLTGYTIHTQLESSVPRCPSQGKKTGDLGWLSNTMLCLYSIPLMWLRLYRCKVRQKQKLDPPKALW